MRELSSSSSSHVDHGKQSLTSQNPLPIAMPYQPKDPKCFTDRGKNSQRSQPYRFDHNDWKTWLHYDQEKDVVFCFSASKVLGKIYSTTKMQKKKRLSQLGIETGVIPLPMGEDLINIADRNLTEKPSLCSCDSYTVWGRWWVSFCRTGWRKICQLTGPSQNPIQRTFFSQAVLASTRSWWHKQLELQSIVFATRRRQPHSEEMENGKEDG